MHVIPSRRVVVSATAAPDPGESPICPVSGRTRQLDASRESQIGGKVAGEQPRGAEAA